MASPRLSKALTILGFGHTRGSYGGGYKHWCLIEVLRGRIRLFRCYLQYIHASRNPRSAFRLRKVAESGCLRRVLLATALSLWRRAHSRAWWSLFVAGARVGGAKSTFRDRCKGSEPAYFEMQISWQVQHFGCGGGLRGALIS